MKKKTKRIPTLHIMRGLPGSGKSTKANSLMQANYSNGIKILRCNRSTVREMLWPQNANWSPAYEKIVKEAERNMVQLLLCMDYDVILDSTNLGNIDHWYSVLSTKKIKLEVHDFRGVSLDLVLKRNQERIDTKNYREPEIIIKLARQHGLLK